MRTVTARLLAVAVFLPLAFTPSAAARSVYPLHAGSHGQRVADLQWLLGGHRPSVFTKVRPTFKGKPNGLYGARTKSAVKAYKYRIGYPAAGQCPESRKVSAVTDTASRQFFDILEGKRQRPICWVAVAQQRVRLVHPSVTRLALQVKQLEFAQLGIHEVPDGSNRGPRISFSPSGWPYPPYQAATGAFGLAWCASLQQWAFEHAGSGVFADRSAGVLYIESWAQKRGYLNAKASVGSLVAFLDDGGHIGYVVAVTASGYATVEGNEGNAVREVWHPWNDRLRVFIDLPGMVKN